jgi:hypothetical protein
MSELTLTAVQKQMAINWVNQRAPNLRCPSCQQNNFVIADHLVTPNVITLGGTVSLGGSTYPQFLVTCNNCGHILYYSAVLAGIMRSPLPEVPSSPTSHLGRGQENALRPVGFPPPLPKKI